MKNWLIIAAGVQTLVLVAAVAVMGVQASRRSAKPPPPPVAASDDLKPLVDEPEPAAEPPVHGRKTRHEAPEKVAKAPAEAEDEAPAHEAVAARDEKPGHEEKAAHEEKPAHEDKGHGKKGHAEPEPVAPEKKARAEPAAHAERDEVAERPAVAEPAPRDLEAVMTRLIEGNDRFAQGVVRTRDLVQARQQAKSVRPAAVVLTCSDAEVPPELIFDAPFGELVVVRSLGELPDEAAVATVEDAVTRAGVAVVVVLGHEGCSAVDGVLKRPQSSGVARLSKVLAPVLKTLKGKPAAQLEADTTSLLTSAAASELLRRSPALTRAAKGGVLGLVRGVYSSTSGQVRWLEAEAAPTKTASAHP